MPSYTRLEEHRREIQNSEENTSFKRFRLKKMHPSKSSFKSSGLHQFQNGGDTIEDVLIIRPGCQGQGDIVEGPGHVVGGR